MPKPKPTHYRILPGASLRDVDGTVKTGGDIIELPEDLVAHHADRVHPEPLSDDEVAAHQALKEGQAAGPADPE